MSQGSTSPLISAGFVRVPESRCEERDRIIQDYLAAVALRNAISGLGELGRISGRKCCAPELEDASARCKDLQRALVEHCLQHGC